MTRRARKSPKQSEMPGAERPVIHDLDSAAEGYVDVRNERMELTAREVEARDVLVGLMRKHGQTVYRVAVDEPLLVTLIEGQAKVRVRKLAEPGAADAETD